MEPGATREAVGQSIHRGAISTPSRDVVDTVRLEPRSQPQTDRLRPSVAATRRVPAWVWVLLLYCGLSFGIFANTWVLHPGGFIGPDGDVQLMTWGIGWVPFAISHGHDPFVTNYIVYPDQSNLLWNTSMLFPGLVLWPVTALFGPLASYNLLTTLAPALCGICAYAAVRRYAGIPASAVGGLLYGFSPYIMDQLGHEHLVVAVYPPLALLALDELFVRQRRSPVVVGALLGAASFAQLLTGEEILATTMIFAVIGTALLMVMFRHEVRARLRHAVTGLGAAAVVGGVLSAYPLKVQFFGPAVVSGTLQWKNFYVSDIGTFVTPAAAQFFHPDRAIETQLQFTGNMSEANFYVGIPLILFLVAAAFVLWRSTVARWCGAMLVIAAVLSMGPHLHVIGHDTGIRLPWAIVGNRKLFDNLLPSRFAVFGFLVIAIIVALMIDRILASRSRLVTSAGLAAVAFALLPLLPTIPAVQTEPPNPSFFTSTAVQRIPADSVALVLPYASGASRSSRAMLWQVESGFRFRMPEGQTFRPGPTFDPRPSELQGVLDGIETGQPVPLTPDLMAAVRANLRSYDVQTVIVGPSPYEADELALFRSLLGDDFESIGGVYVFWNAGRDLGV